MAQTDLSDADLAIYQENGTLHCFMGRKMIVWFRSDGDVAIEEYDTLANFMETVQGYLTPSSRADFADAETLSLKAMKATVSSAKHLLTLATIADRPEECQEHLLAALDLLDATRTFILEKA